MHPSADPSASATRRKIITIEFGKNKINQILKKKEKKIWKTFNPSHIRPLAAI